MIMIWEKERKSVNLGYHDSSFIDIALQSTKHTTSALIPRFPGKFVHSESSKDISRDLLIPPRHLSNIYVYSWIICCPFQTPNSIYASTNMLTNYLVMPERSPQRCFECNRETKPTTDFQSWRFAELKEAKSSVSWGKGALQVIRRTRSFFGRVNIPMIKERLLLI